MFGSLMVLLVLTHCAKSENQFVSAVRNSTNSNKNKRGNDERNFLKNEVKRYIKECGLEDSGENSSEFEQNYNGPKSNKRDGSGGTYPEFYGDRPRHSNSGKNESSKRRFSNGGESNENYRQDDSCRENDRNYNRNYYRNRQGNGNSPDGRTYNTGHGENANYPNQNSRPNIRNYDLGNYQPSRGNQRLDIGGSNRRNVGYGSYDHGNNDPRPRYGGGENFGNDGAFIRVKRNDENCLVQCAFGYLDVLDDNRVPSETAMINYLKNHIQNDRQRINILRDARRCFARLATTDNEDGCEFSKLLANCLKLETQ